MPLLDLSRKRKRGNGMLVKLTRDVGSWIAGSEWDLQDGFAKGLIQDGRAVRIDNKQLKTLGDVMSEQANLSARIEADKLAQSDKAKEVRNKAKRAKSDAVKGEGN